MQKFQAKFLTYFNLNLTCLAPYVVKIMKSNGEYDGYFTIDDLVNHPISKRMNWERSQIEALKALGLVRHRIPRKEGSAMVIELESFKKAAILCSEMNIWLLPKPEEIEKLGKDIDKPPKRE